MERSYGICSDGNMDDVYSYTKKMLLRSLGENSRMSVTELAKQARCSRNTVVHYLDSLEKKFGLRYTVEFEKPLLGMIQNHVVAVRTKRKPDEDFLKKVFEDDNIAQLVATTEGDFNLLIYALSSSGNDYMKWETKLSVKLARYGAEIRPSQLVTEHTGFIPILSSSLEKADVRKFGIDDIDKTILMLLNENSRISYSEIAKRTGVVEDKVRYRFEKICRSGTVRRFTTVMTNPPKGCSSMVLVNYNFSPGVDRRMKAAREYILRSDDDLLVENTFQIVAPISGSYRSFMLACFDDASGSEEFKRTYAEIFKKDDPRIACANVKKVIRGIMPIRNLDARKNYKAIQWEE